MVVCDSSPRSQRGMKVNDRACVAAKRRVAEFASDRGRESGSSPSLRTGLPNFLDPALQLVVNFQEDRHAAVCACFKENKPTAEK